MFFFQANTNIIVNHKYTNHDLAVEEDFSLRFVEYFGK